MIDNYNYNDSDEYNEYDESECFIGGLGRYVSIKSFNDNTYLCQLDLTYEGDDAKRDLAYKQRYTFYVVKIEQIIRPIENHSFDNNNHSINNLMFDNLNNQNTDINIRSESDNTYSSVDSSKSFNNDFSAENNKYGHGNESSPIIESMIKEILLAKLLSVGYIDLDTDNIYDMIFENNKLSRNNNKFYLPTLNHDINNNTNDNNDITPTFVEWFLSSYELVYVSERFGKDLYYFLDEYEDHLPESLCKSIIKQIVTLVSKLHSFGIAHCDLCIENICVKIIDSNLCVRLIDFGFAMVHPSTSIYSIFMGHSLHHSITPSPSNFVMDNHDTLHCSINSKYGICGRLAYISPERFKANSDASFTFDAFKDDVYAIGAVMFVLLSNVIFPNNKIDDIENHKNTITSKTWLYKLKRYVPTISDDAVDLLNMMLCLEEERASIADILNHRWLN